MNMRATGSFQSNNWEEKPYSEGERGQKLSQVTVRSIFSGDVVGEGTLAYLLFYQTESAGTFIGLERFVGSLGGRSGSFVLQHNGTFEGANVQGKVLVLPGSGTGELSGLRGEGSFTARHGEAAVPFVLDYELI